ncbi:hypothetical protein KTT_57070 [Tengunoibacter tsumagoiensis]|uniref:Uncharacterized protein n=1 Tax=Tengunoibacter tsumagoiensis TaxID=2014871 RepID=A0A402A9T1_9CHLR|nr:hypothetical protein KTT_57070 [Tengunoibacter tsumagoiensis]
MIRLVSKNPLLLIDNTRFESPLKNREAAHAGILAGAAINIGSVKPFIVWESLPALMEDDPIGTNKAFSIVIYSTKPYDDDTINTNQKLSGELCLFLQQLFA